MQAYDVHMRISGMVVQHSVAGKALVQKQMLQLSPTIRMLHKL